MPGHTSQPTAPSAPTATQPGPPAVTSFTDEPKKVAMVVQSTPMPEPMLGRAAEGGGVIGADGSADGETEADGDGVGSADPPRPTPKMAIAATMIRATTSQMITQRGDVPGAGWVACLTGVVPVVGARVLGHPHLRRRF